MTQLLPTVAWEAKLRWIAVVVGLVALVTGCAGGALQQTLSPGASSSMPPIVTTTAPSASMTVSPGPDGAALGELGPYGIGSASFETVDATRDDRAVRVLVYYPATGGSTGLERDATPDASGAPYPVVVSDGELGAILGPHLASHGFVYLAIQGQYSWGFTLSPNMIDFPLDQIVALDALAALDDPLLAGLADAERSAGIGYSFGSWNALVLAGARVDPEHYLATCASRPPGWSDHWWEYICGDRGAWAAIAARAEEVGIGRDDGLWASIGDDRIKAVVPMTPEGFDFDRTRGPRGGEGAGPDARRR